MPPLAWLVPIALVALAYRLSKAPLPAGAPCDREALAERLDAVLPQTQCTQCGYPGCAPYARAMAAGEADIDRCPPGGAATIARLAAVLDVPEKPLDPRYGTYRGPQVARIDETVCIGCRLCIKACPTDAIVGAPRLMHTVIESECTGCELCLPPCPVDCIDLLPRPGAAAAQQSTAVEQVRRGYWRARHEAREARLASGLRAAAARQARRDARAGVPRGAIAGGEVAAAPEGGVPSQTRDDARQAVIRAAVARARERRAALRRRERDEGGD